LRVDVSTYREGFDAFWELDLFGRVRSAVRAAAANAESYELSLDDVRVIVAPQQQLAAADRTLANQRETLRLTQTYRYHATWTSSRDASKLNSSYSAE
jgi:multidrug efflux system outer membrane protein